MRPVRGLLITAAAAFVMLAASEWVWPTPIVCLKIDSALADLQALSLAVSAHRAATGALPRELSELSQGPQPVVERIPADPWNGGYQYRISATGEAVLYSPGRNGIDEEGAGDDVTLTLKAYRCETYGVNCPLDPADWLKLALFVLILGSLAGAAGIGVVRLARRVAGMHRP